MFAVSMLTNIQLLPTTEAIKVEPKHLPQPILFHHVMSCHVMSCHATQYNTEWGRAGGGELPVPGGP